MICLNAKFILQKCLVRSQVYCLFHLLNSDVQTSPIILIGCAIWRSIFFAKSSNYCLIQDLGKSLVGLGRSKVCWEKRILSSLYSNSSIILTDDTEKFYFCFGLFLDFFASRRMESQFLAYILAVGTKKLAYGPLKSLHFRLNSGFSSAQRWLAVTERIFFHFGQYWKNLYRKSISLSNNWPNQNFGQYLLLFRLNPIHDRL